MKKINVAYLAWMFYSWKNVYSDFKDYYEEQVDSMLELLPSGSGIDSGVKFDWQRSTKDKLIFTFGFHHMDEHGGYDGWTEHMLVIRPDLQEGFTLTIGGKDRNHIKEYLYQLFGELFYHSVQDSRDTHTENLAALQPQTKQHPSI
jgi:hypothetical protein